MESSRQVLSSFACAGSAIVRRTSGISPTGYWPRRTTFGLRAAAAPLAAGLFARAYGRLAARARRTAVSEAGFAADRRTRVRASRVRVPIPSGWPTAWLSA